MRDPAEVEVEEEEEVFKIHVPVQKFPAMHVDLDLADRHHHPHYDLDCLPYRLVPADNHRGTAIFTSPSASGSYRIASRLQTLSR